MFKTPMNYGLYCDKKISFYNVKHSESVERSLILKIKDHGVNVGQYLFYDYQ